MERPEFTNSKWFYYSSSVERPEFTDSKWIYSSSSVERPEFTDSKWIYSSSSVERTHTRRAMVKYSDAWKYKYKDTEKHFSFI